MRGSFSVLWEKVCCDVPKVGAVEERELCNIQWERGRDGIPRYFPLLEFDSDIFDLDRIFQTRVARTQKIGSTESMKWYRIHINDICLTRCVFHHVGDGDQ